MVTYSHSQGEQRSYQSDRSRNSTFSISVRNIFYVTREQELRSFFDKVCGGVSTSRLVWDNLTGQSRGFGFVQFHSSPAFEAALTLHGSSLGGRKLKISPSQNTPTLSQATISTNATESGDSDLTGGQKTRVVRCKKSNYDVYIDGPSICTNPFVIGRDGDKTERIAKYRSWIMGQPELVARSKMEHRGRIIACWCKPDACHGDILAEIADAD